MNMETQDLSLTPLTKEYLHAAANWALFLSIVFFLLLGLGIILGIGMIAIIPMVSEISDQNVDMGAVVTVFGVIHLFFSALYIFPVYYLNRFGAITKTALERDDQLALETAMGYLKSHYKFIGILVIATISLYILFVIFSVAIVSAFA